MSGTTFSKMNLDKAISLVLNEAEVSALGNKDDSQLEVLEAVEVVKQFYNEYGVVFSDFTKNYNNKQHKEITINKYE
jgi:hypothetical protein